MNTPVGAGLIAGLIMGDLKTGLIIGGAMQLTVLGVGTFGGASKIDATTGTVLATAFSVSIKGMSPQDLLTLTLHTELTTELKRTTTRVLKETSSMVQFLGLYLVQSLYLLL